MTQLRAEVNGEESVMPFLEGASGVVSVTLSQKQRRAEANGEASVMLFLEGVNGVARLQSVTYIMML